MIPAAASTIAARKTSRGWTSELFNNPRVIRTSRSTWLWLSRARRWNSSTCRSRSRLANRRATSSGSRMRWSGGPSQPAAELEGRGQAGGLGRTDALGAKPFGPGPLRQPAQGALAELEQPAGHVQDAAPGPSGADHDGEQLRRGEGGGPERPEALARTVGGWERAHRAGHRRRVTDGARGLGGLILREGEEALSSSQSRSGCCGNAAARSSPESTMTCTMYRDSLRNRPPAASHADAVVAWR